MINDCTSKYKIHLKPFLDSKDFAFCAWYPEGETLKDAVPELDSIIRIKKEWRAVVLADSRSGVLRHSDVNPFDYVGYTKLSKELEIKAQDNELNDEAKREIAAYREYVRTSTDEALSNPLMKLSVWLTGAAVRQRPSAPADGFQEVEPLSAEYEKVRKKLDCTVSDLELSLARAYRFDRLSERFELGGDLFYPPKVIITVAERSVNTETMKAASAWKRHTDYDYSNFIEDNMYSNKLRCLVYEIPRVKDKVKENDYFIYLSTVMILARNEIQSDILKVGRVYEIMPEVDEARMSELCNEYLLKLRLTLRRIAELKHLHTVEASKAMNDAQAREEFESEVNIPVSMDKSFDKSTLMCDYSEIGLSKDCPGDEESYWKSQHSVIRKRFNRFIRQPQRCLEKSVDKEFRQLALIDTEKAKRMTKYQRQDVLIKLFEEEQNMLETHTSKIFDKTAYNMRLDRADKDVLGEIARRMTRRRTLIAGILPAALLLIGFLPLFISELNDLGTAAMSLILTALALAAVIGCAAVMLFIFRKRVADRFKGFNSEMDGIYNEVSGSLGQFSKYLSHAGNVMREFAALNAYDDRQRDLMYVYRKHELDIENHIKEIAALFSDYVEEGYSTEKEIGPFMYDFEQPTTYSYDIPYNKERSSIEFLQNGNRVTIPIDYIKGVRLRREELYD